MGKKVTVTLTEEQVEQVRQEAAEDEGAPDAAVATKDSLTQLLDEMDEEYGPPSSEAVAWAKQQVSRLNEDFRRGRI